MKTNALFFMLICTLVLVPAKLIAQDAVAESSASVKAAQPAGEEEIPPYH